LYGESTTRFYRQIQGFSPTPSKCRGEINMTTRERLLFKALGRPAGTRIDAKPKIAKQQAD